jgi:hypothetical protein
MPTIRAPLFKVDLRVNYSTRTNRLQVLFFLIFLVPILSCQSFKSQDQKQSDRQNSTQKSFPVKAAGQGVVNSEPVRSEFFEIGGVTRKVNR